MISGISVPEPARTGRSWCRRAVAIIWLAAATAMATTTMATTAMAAVAQDPLDAVMALLSARCHARAHFTQQQYLSILDRPLLSSGDLFYDAPDDLRQQINKPRPETLIYNGGRIIVERGRHRYQIDPQRYPQLLPLLQSLRATLAGDRAALERSFHLDFQGTAAHWSLQLIPLDQRLTAFVDAIHITGERDQLRSIDLRQAGGDHSQMQIQPMDAP